MVFADHFSAQAAGYARFRPRYPSRLFQHLATLAPARTVAWDCATGSGQAAAGLAVWFRRTVATDASGAQLRSAAPVERVSYLQARAEAVPLAAAAVDLAVVAQALHWFDHGRFYAEAARVLRPGGVLAVWCYNLLRIAPPIDALIDRFYLETVGPFWPPERRLLETGYRSLPFPFTPCEAPSFAMTASWELADLLGYLRTWSAVARYRAHHANDPVQALATELATAWGIATARRTISWPLALRLGRHEAV